MKRIALGALLVALVAVVAAGCGGGGGSETLSKDEYVSKMDTICADFNAKQEEIGTPASIADIADLGPAIVDEFDKAIGEMKDLKAPDEIKDQTERFISLGEEQRDLLTQLIDAAEANDTAKVNELGEEGSTLDTESDEIATELGATACAED